MASKSTSANPAEGWAAIPPSGTGWGGSAILTPNPANQLIATPTQRQSSFTFADLQTVTDSVVDAVRSGSGKTVI